VAFNVVMETASFAYYNALDQINNAEWVARRLARHALLRRTISKLWPRGHPTHLVQVAGTSGKGSVCRFLEAGFCLTVAGGSLTGPHLFDFRERFRIRGREATQAEVTDAWEGRILPACIERALEDSEHALSFAEAELLLALTLFERCGVAWAAIETGIGGCYDQHSVADPVATAITNVGEDHQERLGVNTWQRAMEKGGIARPGVPLFTTVTGAESLAVLESLCQHVGASLEVVDERATRELQWGLDRLYPHGLPADSLLASEHQLRNAALALAVLRHCLPQTGIDAALESFAEVRVPGRLTFVREGLIVDVAHNVDKMRALAATIQAIHPGRRLILLVGLSGQRSPAEVFAPILPLAKHVIATSTQYRGIHPLVIQKELRRAFADACPIECVEDAGEAMRRAESVRAKDDLVVVTGSTYLIDQLFNPDPYVRHLNTSFGWRGT
jgi:dihydrofolate synthase/folylpolyglutamate synthase